MAINWNKPVQTRDGRKVRILAADARGDYPVIGLIESPGDPTDDCEFWTESGAFYSDRDGSPEDLINVPTPPKKSFYIVNPGAMLGENAGLFGYQDESEAHAHARGRPLVVVEHLDGEALSAALIKP